MRYGSFWCVLLGLLLASDLTGAPPKPPSDAELEMIRAATPDRSTQPPKSARRILIISQCEGFTHSSVPYVEAAFRIMGEKTGAYTTVVKADAAILESDELASFDAIVMNNTTMRLPLLTIDTGKMTDEEKKVAEQREEKAQQNFLNFVRDGKGLIGVHAATDCLYKWPEYGEMIGGYFWGHPWNEDVTVKLDDPGHPLLAAFNGQSFVVKDEIYMFRPTPYSREALRVLMSLDTSKTNMQKGDKIKREDDDFAVAWIRPYGKGRVFYFSLGHRHEIFWNRAVMQCYLDGIQYALGDYPVDDRPSAALTKAYLEQSRQQGYKQGFSTLVAELRSYQMGVDDTVAKTLSAMVMAAQAGDDRQRQSDLSKALASLLSDAETSDDARRFICEQLGWIGVANAVPHLAACLGGAHSDHAVYALVRMPAKEADDALVDALETAKGRNLQTIIAAVGQRRSLGAVPALTKLITAPEPDTAVAAVSALALLPDADVLTVLLRERPAAAGVVRAAMDRALVHIGDELRTKGQNAGAAKAYQFALGAEVAPTTRASAFYGMGITRGREAAAEAIDALVNDDPVLRCAAADLVRDLRGAGVAESFANALPKMAAANRCLALDALAERGDKSVETAILDQLRDANSDVRTTAIAALRNIGTHRCVVPLLLVAANEQSPKAERDAARAVLAQIPSRTITKTLAAELDGAEARLREEIVRVLGERKAVECLDLLIEHVQDDERTVRAAARDSLAMLARFEDVSKVIALLTAAEKSSERRDLEKIIVNVCKRVEDDDRCVQPLLTALQSDLNDEARASLITALGKTSRPPALPAMLAALESGADEVRRAAVKALADWPTPEPLMVLRSVSQDSSDQILRVLALRGYARQLAMPCDRPVRETLTMYAEALQQAQQETEKRTLVDGLGYLAHPDALDMLKPMFEDEILQADALLSASRIMAALDGGAFRFSSSHGQGSEKKAVDGTRDTRWTTGKAMHGGEWIQVDLTYETDVRELMLDAGPVGTDYPRGYEVYVSRDGEEWGEPVAKGIGKEKIFTISFSPTYGRFVKIVQTGSAASNFWSIAEMSINGRPALSKPIPRESWVVSASKSAANCPPENAIDGDLDARWGLGGAMTGSDWFQVDLGAVHTINRLVLDAAKSTKDYPRSYKVMVSADGETWRGPVAMGQGNGPTTRIPVIPTETRYIKIMQTDVTETYWWSIYDLKIYGE